jgi:protein phosphatase 2C family protein 2/3
MEDQYCVHSELIKFSGNTFISLFGVFDGHGGVQTAQFVSNHIHEEIRTQIEKLITESPTTPIDQLLRAQTNLFINAFHNTDEKLRTWLKDPNMSESERLLAEESGSTACIALLYIDSEKTVHIFCANAGDSRCILFDQSLIHMSQDHRPTNEEELTRIMNANGFVEEDRVNGDLAMSRAFGDFRFKTNEKCGPNEQIVVCTPEVSYRTVKKGQGLKFLIIASDGLFDVLSSESVVDFVKGKLIELQGDHELCTIDVEDVTCQLIDYAVKGLDSGDNTSVELILL